jgi:hypothetical protein
MLPLCGCKACHISGHDKSQGGVRGGPVWWSMRLTWEPTWPTGAVRWRAPLAAEPRGVRQVEDP